MILYPAIDLKDGACVRLEKGDMAKVTIFNEDPAAQAQLFESQGFEWIHLVDLNGAFVGKSVNAGAITSILSATSLPVQLGGGIRTMRQAEAWLAAGVRRVILGTAAVRDPGFVREAAKEFPGRVAVGLDARGGMVAVEGWAETSDMTVVDLAKEFEQAGIAAIIYTDIDRDGILTGLNLRATVALAEKISTPVIASGGLAGMDDIRAMIGLDPTAIDGAISGRAIYDGRLNAVEALALLKGQS